MDKLRKPIYAANWKMFKTKDDALSFLYQINFKVKKDVETVLLAPFTYLESLVVASDSILIGAQNMHYLEEGPFTGEISPLMIKSINVDYVLIGHSERRKYYNENDVDSNKKIKAAFKNGLKVIACLGETFSQKEKGLTRKVITNQLNTMLCGINDAEAEELVIAYEPLWAIGTGVSATKSQICDAALTIRNVLKELYNEKVSNKVRILYGGSVNLNNLKDIILNQDIDGVLVGGASLDIDTFVEMVKIIEINHKSL